MINTFKVEGIEVLVNKIEKDKTFSLSICFKTGSKYENEDERGISHFLEHMMFTGTNKRNSFEISEEMDFYGASMNAYTTKNITNYYFSSLSKYQEETLEIFFDMLTDPIFCQNQLNKEKEIIFEEINMDKDDIKLEIYEMMKEKLIDGNLKNNILGSKEEVDRITREKLIKYYEERYTKDNMIVVASGNIDENILKEYIKKYFSRLKDKAIFKKNKSRLLDKEIYIKKDINQVNIYILSETQNINTFKEKIILSIIDYILGSGFSSRLFTEIREKEALSYSIYSYLEFNIDLNLHCIYIGTSNNKYEKALTLTKDLIKKLKTEGISKREFEKAKNNILSNNAKTTGNSTIINKMLNMKILYDEVFEIDYIDKVIEEISIEEINNMVKNIFENYSVAVIGDIND